MERIIAFVFLLATATASADDATTMVTTIGDDVDSTNGTSLREALLLIANSRAPGRIEFDPTLAGQTIVLNAPLPAITVNDTVIIGPPSLITLDLKNVSGSNCSALKIAASGVTISRLRFTNVEPAARALQVYAGSVVNDTCDPIVAPSSIRNVVIADCVFDNEPRETTAYALSVGTDGGSNGTTISDIAILRNRFHHFQGDGTTVHLQLGGDDHVIERVLIAENTFTECMFAVELVPCCGGQERNRISNVTVSGNRFERGGNIGIVLLNTGGPETAPPGTANRIENTTITGNTILRQSHWAIMANGGFNNATGNEIVETEISNNVIAHGVTAGSGAVLAIGGDIGGTSNRVSTLRLVNNTIAFNAGTGLAIANNPGGFDNTVEDVSVRNTIFWQNGADLGDGVAQSEVATSITTHPDFAGRNGNIASDPRFVDPSRDDFQLKAVSPAIDRAVDAPAHDGKCGARRNLPDLGAFEHGIAADVRLFVAGGGTGSGSIQLTPEGRPCGDHLHVFAPGTEVTKTEVADPGSRFQTWVGDTGCFSPELLLDTDRLCVALFRKIHRRRSVRH